MALTLKVHRKEGAQLLELGEGILKVGRAGSSQIVVDDRAASRMHCVIEVPKAGPPVVIDLGSSAGTLVNGKPVSKHELKPGDEVRIGDFRIEVVSLEGKGSSVRSVPAPSGPVPAPPAAARPDRAICPFCKRPHAASAFACPACGAPTPS